MSFLQPRGTMHFELPIASFISIFLSLAPLPWHWRAGTVPTVSISLWLFISNLINGINTIIWANNLRIVVPVWCDISQYFPSMPFRISLMARPPHQVLKSLLVPLSRFLPRYSACAFTSNVFRPFDKLPQTSLRNAEDNISTASSASACQ